MFGSMIFGYSSVSSNFVYNKNISTSIQNYDMYADASANGWDTTSILNMTVTVTSTGIVGGTSTYALTTNASGTFPVGSTLSLVIMSGGYIVGKGGNGANSSNNPSPGAPGLNAINATYAISINNSGTIAGGGGGGGATYGSSGSQDGCGGGGGAGYSAGTGGSGIYNTADNGSSGTLTTGGIGGNDAAGSLSDTGGNGGNLGVAGSAANDVSNPGYGSNGGSRGYYVVGNSLVTWIATGTLLGAQS